MYEGIAQLKERWRKHGNPTKVRRCASLFVSPRGDLVAVASGNQITILQKVDEYQKPRGIFNSDGLIHDIEISQDPSASVFSPLASRSGTMLKQSPQDMICLDYQPELSLFSIVSSAGSLQLTTNGLYSLALCWKSGNLALEVLVSTQFEGFFSIPKDYVGHITSPKVSISPQGRFVAALDMGGSLNTFKFDKEQRALSKCSYGEGNELHQGNKDSDKGNILVNGVIDFAWWSDDILAVAEMNGNIAMINICTGAMLCKKDGTMYSLPLLERVPQMLGKLFLLETKPSVQNNESTKEIRESTFHLMECDRVSFHVSRPNLCDYHIFFSCFQTQFV
ncbi:hypothetical protein BC332_34512 [Capsicum chinense]|nr:hypothetical protein BC332_34512 [Capsicum chinense]